MGEQMNTNGCSPAPRSSNFQFQLIDKQLALADSPEVEQRSSFDPLVRNIIQLGKPLKVREPGGVRTGSFSTLLGSAKDPKGPRRTQKDQEGPSKARKLRQTGQAALAASSFSSW